MKVSQVNGGTYITLFFLQQLSLSDLIFNKRNDFRYLIHRPPTSSGSCNYNIQQQVFHFLYLFNVLLTQRHTHTHKHAHLN